MKIIIALLISILLHFIFYISFAKIDIKNTKLPNKNKKTTSNIRYVKLISKKPIKKIIKPKKIKKIQSHKKIKPIKKHKKIIKPKPKLNHKKIETKKIPKPKLNSKPKKTIKKIKPIKHKNIPKKPILDPITKSYLDLYGDKFKKLPKQTQVYLIKNIKDIGAITKIFLQYPYMSIQARQSGVSVVEFILYPNGTISGLKIIKSSHYFLLDDNTIETINEAYSDYPRPPKPTLIRIYVKYQLIME